MNDEAVEAVNELVVYLAHCNRKEHVATVMGMVRQQAANEQALKDAANDLSGLLAEYRRARRAMMESPNLPRRFEAEFPNG